MKKLKYSLLVLGITFSVFSAKPAEGGILQFRANLLGVFNTGSVWGPQAAWAPSFSLGGFGIRGDFGLALLKDGFGNGFMAFNYEALLTMPFTPLFGFEIGGGMNSWLGGRGTHPIFSTNFTMGAPFGVLDTIFIGYSRFFVPNNGTNELKIGIGLTF